MKFEYNKFFVEGGPEDILKRLNEIGAAPIAPERRTPEYLATFVEHEIAKWARVVAAAGIKVN